MSSTGATEDQDEIRIGYYEDWMLDQVIDMIAKYAPGIRQQIVHAELLSPVDIEREFRIHGGH